MKEYALLIGNGLNRAADNKAWADMLDEIREKYGVEAASDYTNMPLEFERIYLEALRNGTAIKSYTVKKHIAEFLPSVVDLSLHREFAALPINTLMTSNYDYYLEQAIDADFKRKSAGVSTSERKHSLFRYLEIGTKRVWHIHGEAHCPDSICLGYDHYCMGMSKMIEYLTRPLTGVSKKPLLRHWAEGGEFGNAAWPTLFFTHDIFIVGMTLSFLELDLWWLLNHRIKFCLENPEYCVENEIHYFYAASEEKVNDEQISLLESAGVILHPVPLVRKNWKKLYSNILSNIKDIVNTG